MKAKKEKSIKLYERFNPYKMFVGIYIPNCLLALDDLSPTAKLCWGRLAQYSGEDGRCFPSQKTLAKELGLSTRRIQSIIKELSDKGFIEISHAKTKEEQEQHQSNEYFFLFHPCFFNSNFIRRK